MLNSTFRGAAAHHNIFWRVNKDTKKILFQLYKNIILILLFVHGFQFQMDLQGENELNINLLQPGISCGVLNLLTLWLCFISLIFLNKRNHRSVYVWLWHFVDTKPSFWLFSVQRIINKTMGLLCCIILLCYLTKN